MTWAIRPGHEHNFIDGRTQVHHVHLFNQVTGGEHNIELLLGCPCCPSCKRPFEQSDLSLLDPNAEIEKHLGVLSGNHDALMGYIAKHGHPLRIGPLGTVLPEGHRTSRVGDHRYLHGPKDSK